MCSSPQFYSLKLTLTTISIAEIRFNLLEAIADFGNKLRLGTAPRCLALIRSDGRAGTKHLLAEEHLICGRAEGILAKR
jgi:hypothetical protein